MTKAEEKLLLLCTYHPPRPDELHLIAAAVAEVRDWPTFVSLAALNHVQPIALHALAAAGALDAVPAAARAELEQAADKVKKKNTARLQNAKLVLRRVADENIPLCLLKGVLFAETIYKNPCYKRMNDVDMLVHLEDIPRLEAIYKELGYFYIGERVGAEPKKQKKTSHHLPPYVSRDLTCLLGTQWGLKSPLVGLKIDYARIWQRTRPLDFYGIPLRQMAPIDNLFHVCIHLGFFKTGLRDVMDIYNLARVAGDDIDYAEFVREVREAGAQDLVFHSLSLAHAMGPAGEGGAAFAQVVAELRPHVSEFMRRSVEKKTVDVSTLVRLCSGHLSSIEKAISEFNASESPREKARYYAETWKHILLPSYDDARRICFEPQAEGVAAAKARLHAPVQIVRAISAEIGGFLLTALMVKATFDVARTLIDPRRWRKSGQQDLEAFASARGVTLADLQRVKDGIF